MNEKLTKVEFTNLDKIIFPKLQITKAQVIKYYIKTAPKMLGILANRPLVLTRFPNGINQKGFYEKDAPQGTPAWVKKVKIHSETAKRDVNYVLCNDLDTLIWLANLAAIEIHMPFSQAGSRENPDFIFLTITHLILIFSSIFIYFGFILPKGLKKFLIKSHLVHSFE